MSNSEKLARRQRTELRAFAQEVMQVWLEEGELNNCDLQELGLKHGLLAEVSAHESCGIGCTCYHQAAFLTVCVRFSSLLTGDRADPSPQSDPTWAGYDT